MLYGERSRRELEELLTALFKSEEVLSRKGRQEIYDQLKRKFNMSAMRADDMITFKRNIQEFTTFECFCVLYALDRDSLKKYFTADEISAFENERFEEEKITFPITFRDMIQVTDDQWIGKINARELMKLKDSKLINYNENEQRALRRMKLGQEEVFIPFVNQKAVEEIKSLMERGLYIPDPLTLNIPEGSKFNYNEDSRSIIVYELVNGMFNLNDGYHRYLAISRICDFNPEFDLTMELRIVNFDQAKASTFIFQLDQKTMMKRVVSRTYDVNSIENKIVNRINDGSSNIRGMISRNGKIKSPEFIALLSDLWKTKDVKQSEAVNRTIEIKKELERKFDALTEQDSKFLDDYTTRKLFVVMCVFASNAPINNYAEIINWILNTLEESEKRYTTVTQDGRVPKKGIGIVKQKTERWVKNHV